MEQPRVEIRCGKCGALSATIHATKLFGPVLTAYVPMTKEELAAVNDGPDAVGLEPVKQTRAEAVHYLDDPTMTATSTPELFCAGRGRNRGHGPLGFEIDHLLDVYRRAGGSTAKVLLQPRGA
jgi:hypothetical protein